MTLQTVLDEAVAAAEIPGAVAVIGTREGAIEIAASGQRDMAGAGPMMPDTVFQIASMTKAIVSVGALQLVEQGRLSLHDPLDQLLPDLANAQVITGFDADGKVQLRPAKRPITLHHLLTHTSGFAYDFTSLDMARARGATPPKPASMAALRSPLLFDPGERWEYGISTDWVGLAIEAATGSRLNDWLESHIMAPLAMPDTRFFPDDAKRARAATIHSRTLDGLVPTPMEMGGGPKAEVVGGGGGLYSSAPDYMRFLRMILNNGELDGARILTPETVALLRQNQIGDLRAGRMNSIMPELSGQFDLLPDQHTQWSYGFLINPEKGPNGRAAGSLAWAGIANCYYWIDPANGLAAILLSQLLPFGDEKILEALGAVERYTYSAQ